MTAPSRLGDGLKALAFLHTIVGLLIFRKPIKAWIQAGIVNQVKADPDCQIAFWFLMSGWLLHRLGKAIAQSESASTVGTLCLPRSGFPLGMALAQFSAPRKAE